MIPTPMGPAQNALVILAAFLVAGALLPWSPLYRLACAGAAGAIVVLLLVARLRAHTPPAARDPSVTQERIDRIRAERAARMDRRK